MTTIEYNGVRFKTRTAPWCTGGSSWSGGPLRCYTVYLCLNDVEEPSAATWTLVRERIEENDHLIYGLEKDPLKVISQCCFVPEGGCYKWGFWTNALNESQRLREEFKEIMRDGR